MHRKGRGKTKYPPRKPAGVRFGRVCLNVERAVAPLPRLPGPSGGSDRLVVDRRSTTWLVLGRQVGGHRRANGRELRSVGWRISWLGTPAGWPWSWNRRPGINRVSPHGGGMWSMVGHIIQGNRTSRGTVCNTGCLRRGPREAAGWLKSLTVTLRLRHRSHNCLVQIWRTWLAGCLCWGRGMPELRPVAPRAGRTKLKSKF